MKVKDCMCKEVCYLKPETTIVDTAKLMNDQHIGSVPICDEEKRILGIVTDRDIVLRGIANGKDINSTPISEIMTTNVCSCMEEDDIFDAQNKMSEKQIRRLIVSDENNKIVGILTLGNMVQNENIETDEVGETLENICACKENETNNS